MRSISHLEYPKNDTKSDSLLHVNVTKTKESLLRNLVIDCTTYRLSEKESLEYISKRYKKISCRHYYRIKQEILSDQEINDFFCSILGEFDSNSFQ